MGSDERAALVRQTVRDTHRSCTRVRTVLNALEHVVAALEDVQTGSGPDALRSAAKELDWARRTSEAAVRDTQELVDRTLDGLGATPRLILSSGEEQDQRGRSDERSAPVRAHGGDQERRSGWRQE